MENKFNNLTSKEWLPFQKSWFKYDGLENLIENNIQFFTKTTHKDKKKVYINSILDKKKIEEICKNNNVVLSSEKNNLTFAIIDLLDIEKNFEKKKIIDIINICKDLYLNLEDRKFICILAKNFYYNNKYYPFAWDLAKNLSNIFSLKDEKIGCLEKNDLIYKNSLTNNTTFYSLYFRKDENSKNNLINFEENFILNSLSENKFNKTNVSSWNIIKPKPRKKNEILHPAKYPEDLVKIFLNIFSKKGENIFDPMSGTGSTQVASLFLNRNAFGCELSNFFYKIAIERCHEILNPRQTNLFEINNFENLKFEILNLDCRKIKKEQFPQIDYIITSPPYWDMLNMKGSENQAKRKEKNLQLNYSDSENDLGNIDNYDNFLNELVSAYLPCIDLLKKNRYFTIIVKNIKKGGTNYPLAWDLSKKLTKKNLIILPEIFWLQDDLSIAPYGYGNTFVTNTFHHYCLNFQKK
jgi:DNA modification methylase